jgi:hypothetical protein
MLPTRTHRDGTKPRRLAVTAAVTLVLVLLVACGDDHAPSDRDGTPHIPSQGDPAFGVRGNVLISDLPASKDASVDRVWVGFNSQMALGVLVRLAEESPLGIWIGGRVIADLSHPLGFYFDPSTTVVGANEVGEQLRTSLDSIKADPKAAEESQPGRWMVRAAVEQIVSNPTAAPPLPAPGDPAFGTAGNALISDRLSSVDASLDQLWIGFNEREEWDSFVALNERLRGRGTLPYVGGHLVASARHPLGFYFDPATTVAGGVFAETYETALDALKHNPEAAERDQPGRWVVAATVERLVPVGE